MSLSLEYIEFVREVLKAAMKEIDRIEVHDDSPLEAHLTAAYDELDKADELAKKLQKDAPYESYDETPPAPETNDVDLPEPDYDELERINEDAINFMEVE